MKTSILSAGTEGAEGGRATASAWAGVGRAREGLCGAQFNITVATSNSESTYSTAPSLRIFFFKEVNLYPSQVSPDSLLYD